MTWKAIGKSVTGTSHIAAGRGCEDSLCFGHTSTRDGHQAIVCCVSDGAGSAEQAAQGAALISAKACELSAALAATKERITEADIWQMAEQVYEAVETLAMNNSSELQEYAATLLGCIITAQQSIFFQVGDGAIVRSPEQGGYCVVWWPQNGEYHNTTSFITDNRNLPDLQVVVYDEPTYEVAIFTDGLQMLALNTENRSAHEPFFRAMFSALRQATDDERLRILDAKLEAYLASHTICARTDDDKTLFLATKTTA